MLSTRQFSVLTEKMTTGVHFALGALFTLVFAAHVNAATYGFSFTNEDGPIAGTISGTIELSDGDGTFAASSLFVTSAPSAFDYASGFDWTSFSTGVNSFTVSGGSITTGRFFGSFNGATSFALDDIADDASFLDLLNANDFGATGARDNDSSTLTFGAAPAPVPLPAGMALLLGGLGVLGAMRRRAKV